jgi:DNA anti-recombination protein RmuC
MARQGISEQQVIEAAEQLAQSGQAVTVAAVREVIGSGSFSTINAWLAKWKESGDRGRPLDVPEMPEPVGRAMRQLWAAAWKEAQSGIKAEREALESARRDMERERRDMTAEITRLETEIGTQAEELARLRDQLEAETAARAKLEEAANSLRIENARLDERAKGADSRNEELRRELEQLHARFREVAREGTGKPKPSGPRRKAGTPSDG